MRTLLLALAILFMFPAVTQAYDALTQLNARRASLGLPPFSRDPILQARAEQNVQIRASRGITGHLGSGPRCRGVGWNSRRSNGALFSTCYATMPGTTSVGAAWMSGPRGEYYALTFGNQPSASSGSGAARSHSHSNRRIRIFRRRR